MTQKKAQLMVPPAGTAIGAVKAGSGVTIASDGTISLPPQVFCVNGTNIRSYNAGSGGTGSHNFFQGCEAGFSNTTGNCNVFIGFEAGKSTTTSNYNIFIGALAGHCHTAGIDNIFIGRAAGAYTTGGVSNIYIGAPAGGAATTADDNTIVGNAAGQQLTTGSCNTFFGLLAGSTVTTGSRNSFFGTFSGPGGAGCYNSAFGESSGGDGPACYNSAIGYQSSFCNTTGSWNTTLGACSGKCSTTGVFNTYVGWNSACDATVGSNNIVIGASWATVPAVYNVTTDSNRIVLGNINHTNAYVKVAWTVTSDERDKTCFQDLPYGLAFVENLEPLQYNWQNRETGEVTDAQPRFGFKAQSVLSAEGNPPVLVDNEDLENLKLRETLLIPVLVKAIQELSDKVKSLEQTVSALTQAG